MVTLGTGIGGGIISGGRLIEGIQPLRRASSVTWSSIRTVPAARAASRGVGSGSRPGSGLGALGREMAIAGDAPRLVELAGGDPESVRGEHVTAAAAEGDARRRSRS